MDPIADPAPATAALRLVVGDRHGAVVEDRLVVHDALREGLPAAALIDLVEATPFLTAVPDALERALGIGLRTLQRRRREGDRTPLSAEQSSRLWKFAEILDRATAVFGGRAEAEAWFVRPAMALDGRRPLDLLATSAGIGAVETVLTRLDHGVYT